MTFAVSSELREIANLADYLTDTLTTIEVVAEVIDSNGKTLGRLRPRPDDDLAPDYVFDPKGES